MRKILLTLSMSLFFIPFVSFAQGSGERIKSFHSDIIINSDATVNVTENIQYDFGHSDKDHHGIYRYIPYKYKTDDGKKRLMKVTDVSVEDGKGSPYNFIQTKSGDFIKFKIGDADRLVMGLKTYIISYKVDGAINYFDARDELYWNVTGNDWEVPVDKASANISLSQNIEESQLAASCYMGSFGENEGCETAYTGNGISYTESKALSAGEGLTVAIGFPKGIVSQKDYIYEVPFLSTALGKLWLVGNILAPVLAFAVMFIFWLKKGKDPRGKGTIIAQYDAPDGVDPIAVGTLVDQKVDKKDISAGIIELAVKGYLKIKRIESGKILKKKDYELTKLKGSGALTDYEQKLMDSLFDGGNKIKLKDLRTSFAEDVREVQKLVFASLVNRGYFAKSPRKVRNTYIIVGSVLLFVGFFGMMFVPGVIAIGVIIMIFSFFMPARTLKGVTAKEHTLGLKEYLSIAEKDRIKFHNAPKKNPKTFEKFLPYAMALGVEKEWAKQFEGIFTENPSWYSDPSMTAFSTAAFVSGMNSFSSATGAVSTPASSGGSGVGGSGFSGGGFGGGGGGSW